MPQLPCSPCMRVALFSHYLHRRKAHSCCALTAILSFPLQFQHIPPADPTLPWTFSPCRTALARQRAEWSWGKWSVHAGSCPILTSHPSLSRFTPSLCLPKLVPNPPPFWLQVLAAQGEAEHWEAQAPAKR